MTKAGEGILRGAKDALDYVRGEEGETKGNQQEQGASVSIRGWGNEGGINLGD